MIGTNGANEHGLMCYELYRLKSTGTMVHGSGIVPPILHSKSPHMHTPLHQRRGITGSNLGVQIGQYLSGAYQHNTLQYRAKVTYFDGIRTHLVVARGSKSSRRRRAPTAAMLPEPPCKTIQELFVTPIFYCIICKNTISRVPDISNLPYEGWISRFRSSLPGLSSHLCLGWVRISLSNSYSRFEP